MPRLAAWYAAPDTSGTRPPLPHFGEDGLRDVVSAIQVDVDHHVPDIRIQASHRAVGRIRPADVDHDVDWSEFRPSEFRQLRHLLFVRRISGENLDFVAFVFKLLLKLLEAVLTPGGRNYAGTFPSKEHCSIATNSAGCADD